MGFNWKKYLNEGVRVLEYNGEIIISESIERYKTIKENLKELKMKIILIILNIMLLYLIF
jgi:hypothetical protein